MSKGLYVGIVNKGRSGTDISVGVGGVARTGRSAYIGDEEGKARLFYGAAWQPGVITPDNMTSDTTPAPYCANTKSSYSLSYYVPWFLFNTGANYLFSANGEVAGDTCNWWFEIDLGEKRFANRGRIRYYDSTNTQRVSPVDFQIFGSNNDNAFSAANTDDTDLWTLLGSVTDYPSPTGAMMDNWGDEFILDNPGYYRYYRIRVTRGAWVASAAGSHNTIGQIELSAT
jgi:hypothetical protein